MARLDEELQNFSKRLNLEYIEDVLHKSPHSNMGWSGKSVYDLAFMLKFFMERNNA
jgi:hypothetical protein